MFVDTMRRPLNGAATLGSFRPASGLLKTTTRFTCTAIYTNVRTTIGIDVRRYDEAATERRGHPQFIPARFRSPQNHDSFHMHCNLYQCSHEHWYRCWSIR